MAFAFFLLSVKNPVVGINDPSKHSEIYSVSRISTQESLAKIGLSYKNAAEEPAHFSSFFNEILAIFSNLHFLCALMGRGCVYFSFGILSEWFATFLFREKGMIYIY